MKKTIAAVVAGTLLVATQAFATTQAAPRVGDRLGAAAGESEEFGGSLPAGLIFVVVAAAAVAGLSAVSDEADSD